MLETFYEEVYYQDLVIAPKKLSTLLLFINKMEENNQLLDQKHPNTIRTEL